MTRTTRGLIAIAACAVFGQVSAQDQDCVLAERYYALAQDSIAEFDENAAAGWLQQAAAMCPRFIYFQEFGKIRMQSFDEAEKAEAVDAFLAAHAVAETDSERAAALFQYASLLHREGETQGAQELIVQAQQLAPGDSQIAELAGAVQAQIDHPTQVQTVRALGTTFYKPINIGSNTLRAYPWPPEAPSTATTIHDRSRWLRVGMSLSEVQELLSRSLNVAKYSDWSLYSAPGGFVMVTRFEAIEEDGTPRPGTARYPRPDDESDFGFIAFINSLFDAPEGHYRFIAFVVSDEPYTARSESLEQSIAARRLRGGTRLGLPDEYDDMQFTEDHKIEALIYEFQKRENSNEIEPVFDGISAEDHLQKSRLSEALFN